MVYPAVAMAATTVYGMERSTGKIFAVDPTSGTAIEVYDVSWGPAQTNVSPKRSGLRFRHQPPVLHTVWAAHESLLLGRQWHRRYRPDLVGLADREIACATFVNGEYYYISGGRTSGGATIVQGHVQSRRLERLEYP